MKLRGRIGLRDMARPKREVSKEVKGKICFRQSAASGKKQGIRPCKPTLARGAGGPRRLSEAITSRSNLTHRAAEGKTGSWRSRQEGNGELSDL